MPLSKEMNRVRMRESRLHAKTNTEVVQPNALEDRVVYGQSGIVGYDADGQPIYDD